MEEPQLLFEHIEDLALKQALLRQISSNRQNEGHLVHQLNRVHDVSMSIVRGEQNVVRVESNVCRRTRHGNGPPRSRHVQMIVELDRGGFRSGRDRLRDRAQEAKEKLHL